MYWNLGGRGKNGCGRWIEVRGDFLATIFLTRMIFLGVNRGFIFGGGVSPFLWYGAYRREVVWSV